MHVMSIYYNEHTKHAHKRKQAQIIPVLLHPHQQVCYLCVNDVANNLQIIEHLAVMNQ